jgi:hypothetical protein
MALAYCLPTGHMGHSLLFIYWIHGTSLLFVYWNHDTSHLFIHWAHEKPHLFIFWKHGTYTGHRDYCLYNAYMVHSRAFWVYITTYGTAHCLYTGSVAHVQACSLNIRHITEPAVYIHTWHMGQHTVYIFNTWHSFRFNVCLLDTSHCQSLLKTAVTVGWVGLVHTTITSPCHNILYWTFSLLKESLFTLSRVKNDCMVKHLTKL